MTPPATKDHCGTITCFKTWKQAACPLTGIKKKVVLHIYRGILVIKWMHHKVSVLIRWMNLEPTIINKVRKRKPNAYCISIHIREPRKMVLMNLRVWQQRESRHRERNRPTAGRRERRGWEERREQRANTHYTCSTEAGMFLHKPQGAQSVLGDRGWDWGGSFRGRGLI